MSTLRELKGRIGSVASTEKITGAMKMISSAKMHKFEQALKRLLPYRNQVESIIGHLLATDGTFSSPLIEIREVKKMAFVVFGSDDGLCGAYNINIFKGFLQSIAKARAQYGDDLEIVIFPIGKKMAKAAKKLDDAKLSVQPVTELNTRSTLEQVSEFTETLKSQYLNGEVDEVKVVYMHYKSVSHQTLKEDQLLPVSYDTLVESCAGKHRKFEPCLFEPSANAIFNSVLPLHILATMQDIFTENNASEQAARVMAMQSASDNAKNLLDDLQLEYNKLRQQGITTELLDIVGGQVER